MLVQINFVIVLIVSILAAAYKLPTRIIIVFALLAVLTTPKAVREWNNYHYWIGTKYIQELGPGATNLYECTLLALDAEVTRRDLTTYEFIDGESNCNTTSFSEVRWNEFVVDVQSLGIEQRTLLDKGLNATPTWIAFAEPLAQHHSPSVLMWLDIIALILVYLFVGKLTNWRKASLVLLFFLCFYGVHDRWIGNFAQYIAIAVSIVAVALHHKSHHRLGGALIGIAAALRIFPIFLLLGKPKIAWAYAIATGAVMGVFGFANSHGADAYVHMLTNLQLHSNYIEREPYNIGLSQIITVALSPDTAEQHMEIIRGNVSNTELHYQINPILTLLLLPLVVGSPIGIMFSLLTLSRYYFVLVAIEGMKDDERPLRALFAFNAVMLFWIGIDTTSAFIYGQIGWIIIFALYWYWSRTRSLDSKRTKTGGSVLQERCPP
ncbi:MAG: glycosyltransferase family 87 protein [Chloroflexota bacterium]